MNGTLFSDNARIVFEQARTRIKRWPELSPVSITLVQQAAIATGLIIEAAEFEADEALKLSGPFGCFYIASTTGLAEAEWPVDVSWEVHATGQKLYFRPMYQLDIRTRAEELIAESSEFFLTTIERLVDTIQDLHAPELFASSIALPERLEQEHTAEGCKWFCARELKES